MPEESIIHLSPEDWDAQKKILVILAHPDDPEFFCGGTLSRWIKAGHIVNYCLMTRGDKGSNDQSLSGKQIAHIRTKEQENAARFLGVSEISYLDYPDGYIVSDIDTRKKIVLEIRKKRPDIVVSCDPLYYYRLDKYINHPDHRATGQNVVDAVFPAAGNAFYFPELLDRGFLPHTIEELWLASPSEANTIIDITANFPEKLNALYHHASQIGDRDQFTGRMMDRRTHDSSSENPRFDEKFRRLFLK